MIENYVYEVQNLLQALPSRQLILGIVDSHCISVSILAMLEVNIMKCKYYFANEIKLIFFHSYAYTSLQTEKKHTIYIFFGSYKVSNRNYFQSNLFASLSNQTHISLLYFDDDVHMCGVFECVLRTL